MKLSQAAIEKIDIAKTRLQLALALGFTEAWVIKLLAQNKDNGPLTTVRAIQIIEQETGLKQREILEVKPAKVA